MFWRAQEKSACESLVRSKKVQKYMQDCESARELVLNKNKNKKY